MDSSDYITQCFGLTSDQPVSAPADVEELHSIDDSIEDEIASIRHHMEAIDASLDKIAEINRIRRSFEAEANLATSIASIAATRHSMEGDTCEL